MDLADIVNQRVQLPLYIHFVFGAKGKTMHALLDTDIGKDGFNNPQPPGVDPLRSYKAVEMGVMPSRGALWSPNNMICPWMARQATPFRKL